MYFSQETNESWRKGRQSKSAPVLGRFPEVEKYVISQKGNFFLIDKFYRSKNMIWWNVLTDNDLYGIPAPVFFV